MNDVVGWRMRAASLSALARGALGAVRGERRTCVACGRRVLAFLPWRGGSAALPELSRELGMVGSDVDNFGCPRCGSTDRERHLILYLSALGLRSSFQGARVLHFAPEPAIARVIEDLAPANYIRADLAPSGAGVVRIDIENIPHTEGSFDWVIANHVLEHVGDLPAAVREIGRVLAPGGRAILQTPWCAGLASTIEDRGVTAPHARRALYAQEDHVRLFGRDVFEKICPPGMRAEVRDHGDALPDRPAHEYGVNGEEPLMLFVRN